HKKKKRLIFPVGDFWTSLSTPEFVEAMKRGIISEIKNIAVYSAEFIFENYVDYFYRQRRIAKKEGDAVHDYLFKIFLNSLYGKFGQTNVKWEAVGEADPEEIDYIQIYHAETKEWETLKIFGGKVW